MKKLIINADDFGMSEAYNYGVIHAYQCGVATSASIMSNMDAAVHAAALAKMHPGLCISQHTNIVHGYSCSDPKTIPSIVRPDGSFYRSGEYKGDGFIKKGDGERVPDKEDVKRETRAQLERFKILLGYYPVHMEGHSIGVEPVMQAIKEVAIEYGIHYMTFEASHQEGFHDVAFPVSDPKFTQFMGDYHKTGLTVDGFINILEHLKGVEEEYITMHCHPGYVCADIMDMSTLVFPRCRDVQVLCDPRVAEWIRDNGIELVRYDALKIA